MNIDGHEYTDYEIQSAVERSFNTRWSGVPSGSWAERRYELFSMVKFRSNLRTIAATNGQLEEEPLT